jgi:nickel-dependent lactate racemase
MKTVEMKYGTGTLSVPVSEENLIGIIEKEIPDRTKSEEEIIAGALARPIGTPRLREIVKPGQTVTIVVSDITRLWQRMSVFLPFLVEELGEAGVGDEDIRFLSALGFHRTQTAEEHAKILGEKLVGRYSLIDHVCQDEANLVELGKTSRGTPVHINRIAAESDHIVLTGCCTYHPFTGWAGGAKSLLPGIAGFQTIQHNHRFVMADEVGGGQRPEVRNGNIEGNPVWEDMLEAAALAKPSFLFNVIMGYDGKIAHAVSGHPIEAHARARGLVEDLYGVPIEELADLTIASQGGFPKDIEFYQTGKAVYHGVDSLKPGGTLVVLSECPEGLGPEEARAIFEDFGSSAERETEVRRLFAVPKYVSCFMCTAAEKYDIIAVTSLDPEKLKRTKIRAVRTLEEALDLVAREKGTNLRTYLMPLGSSVLPILRP